jgi:hypothetical protein
MMAGFRDTDKGLKDIREEIAKLSSLYVKAGIVESEGTKKGNKRIAKIGKSGKKLKSKTLATNDSGPTIAEYAAWNEYGVPGRIPSRPFIRGWVENNTAKINATQERLFKQVSEGKLDAENAVARLGQFAQDGIKRYIKEGDFTENADITKKRKKSSRPLIDTGTMRNSVRYEVKKK